MTGKKGPRIGRGKRLALLLLPGASGFGLAAPAFGQSYKLSDPVFCIGGNAGDGCSDTLKSGYTYLPAPTVSGVGK